jgi:hypothetical protein
MGHFWAHPQTKLMKAGRKNVVRNIADVGMPNGAKY